MSRVSTDHKIGNFTQPRATNDDLRVLIAELSGKVSKVDSDYAELRNTVVALSQHIDRAVGGIHEKIDSLVRPQWQTYIAAAGFLVVLLGSFWAAGITPIKETQYQHALTVERLTEKTDRAENAINDRINRNDEKHHDIFLTRREHDEFKERLVGRTQFQSDFINRLDQRVRDLETGRK